MKNRLFLTFLCILATFQNHCGNDFTELSPTCRKLQKLDPWGNQEEYVNLAQDMRKKNLSLGDCIQQIGYHKKEKAWKAISNKPMTFEQSYEKNLIFNDVRCDADIPETDCLTIQEVFSESKHNWQNHKSEKLVKVKLNQEAQYLKIGNREKLFILLLSKGALEDDRQSLIERELDLSNKQIWLRIKSYFWLFISHLIGS